MHDFFQHASRQCWCSLLPRRGEGGASEPGSGSTEGSVTDRLGTVSGEAQGDATLDGVDESSGRTRSSEADHTQRQQKKKELSDVKKEMIRAYYFKA